MNKNTLQALCVTVLLAAGICQAKPIDADMTGNWLVPSQVGHGLQIEVLDLSTAVVAWYTFDTQGNPIWLLGTGEIEGDTLRAELRDYRGTRFPPNFDTDSIEGRDWGDVVVRRTGCDSAALSYTPAEGIYQPAEFPLERVTRIDGAHCSESIQWSQQRRWTPASQSHAFEALFLDYPAGDESNFDLTFEQSPLPEPWQDLSGLRVSGNNRSDDLMMVVMHPSTGCSPTRAIARAWRCSSRPASRRAAPAWAAHRASRSYMRLGAAGEKPDYAVIDGYRRATLDLGQQASPGERALSAGNMANGADEEYCSGTDAPWQLKRVSTAGQDFSVTSDETGRIWVYGLSDSGFEATTTWYLTEFVVRLAGRVIHDLARSVRPSR